MTAKRVHASSADDDNHFVFQPESTEVPPPLASRPWKIMIVDDDDEVHAISRMVLREFAFEGRGIEFLSAHSGADAMRLMAEHPDTAVLLLDVVMESDTAGLDVVHHVRQTLGNPFVRIVLRTGQPGLAPERAVIVKYDINDYKEKTELTAQKLVTTIIAALRAYRDIQTIETSRKGLEQIVGASSNLFQPRSLLHFSADVLRQLTSLLQLDADGRSLQLSGFTAVRKPDADAGDYRILAATGRYSEHIGSSMQEHIPAESLDKLWHGTAAGRSSVDDDRFIGLFRTSNGTDNIVYLQAIRPISSMEARLLEVFSTNLAIAFDNVYLNEELANTQAELINTLSDVIETRCADTGHHVARVGETARLLAEMIGLPESDQELILLAAPMHDLGKIGIPDVLLQKPGRLSVAEFEVIKTHTSIGYNILKGSKRERLRTAAIVALQHHEWWDGTGYPRSIRGEDIHIFGRIVAVADVFDALSHARHYKCGWPMERITEHFMKERGTHFDPLLVDAFTANARDFAAITEQIPDSAVGMSQR